MNKNDFYWIKCKRIDGKKVKAPVYKGFVSSHSEAVSFLENQLPFTWGVDKEEKKKEEETINQLLNDLKDVYSKNVGSIGDDDVRDLKLCITACEKDDTHVLNFFHGQTHYDQLFSVLHSAKQKGII